MKKKQFKTLIFLIAFGVFVNLSSYLPTESLPSSKIIKILEDDDVIGGKH